MNETLDRRTLPETLVRRMKTALGQRPDPQQPAPFAASGAPKPAPTKPLD